MNDLPIVRFATEHAQVLMALTFALPCFLMSARLFAVWRDPMAVEGGRWVRLGIGVFVMEFILAHAGIMLASFGGADSPMGEWGGLIGLTLFYGLFALAISAAFQSRMLLHSFLWLIGLRYAAIVLGISAAESRLLLAHSLVAMFIYFPMVFLSVLLPWPRWGITETIAAEQRDPAASGSWVEEPHRAIGPAAVYFLLLGLTEVGLMTWIDPRRIG